MLTLDCRTATPSISSQRASAPSSLMSLWGLVSTISDSGAAFIASTARDLADFKHALQDETRDIQAAISTTTADDAQHSQPKHAQSATSEGGDEDSVRHHSSSTASLSSLTSNIERLGGRVLHLLPNPFKHDSDHAAGEAKSTSTRSPVPRGAASWAGQAPVSPFSTARDRSGVDRQLLNAMRDRRTYEADPVDPRTLQPPAAYISFAASFQSECALREAELSVEWSEGLNNHPSLRHLYEQLVETGQVDERTFWCRYSYVRHRLHEDERRRQKLANRLAGITTAAAHQTRTDDELQWEDEDEDEVQREAEQRQQHEHASDTHNSSSTDRAHSDSSPSSSPDYPVKNHPVDPIEPGLSEEAAVSSQATAAVWRRPRNVNSAIIAVVDSSAPLDSNEAGSEGDGELLSPSPVSSEGSGELVEHHDATASSILAAVDSHMADEDDVDSERPAHNQSTVDDERTAHSQSTAAQEPTHITASRSAARAATTAAGETDEHSSDYDDWE